MKKLRKVICSLVVGGVCNGKCNRKTCHHGSIHSPDNDPSCYVKCPKFEQDLRCVPLTAKRTYELLPIIFKVDEAVLYQAPTEEYGYECIIDIKLCHVDKFHRYHLNECLSGLCKRLDVQKMNVCWCDYADLDLSPHAEAMIPDKMYKVSACQFTSTNSILIHTLPRLGEVFVNIFSCSSFDEKEVVDYVVGFFGGVLTRKHFIYRGADK